ncbi:MAG TPA: CBS domain-containing protein [Myxococcota bacterium]|nr:CBS domain-containing protein [Myxococcota bacterium]
MNVGTLLRREPATVSPATPCSVAAQCMRDERMGSLVVVEDGEPIGMLTDRDLVVRVLAEGLDAEKALVGEVMSERPIFVTDTQDTASVLCVMRDLALRRVPVVNGRRELVGVVSLDDILVALAEELGTIAELVRKESPPEAD